MLFKHKVTYQSIEFDSKDEMMRYIDLCDRQKRGEISCLHRQVSFLLIPKQSKMVVKRLKTKDKMVEKFLENPAIYTCDFLYLENGVYVCEDTKSIFTRSVVEDYPLRRKLMVQKIQTHNSKNHGQLIIMPYPEVEFEEVEELSDSDRGDGGYGSTGK